MTRITDDNLDGGAMSANASGFLYTQEDREPMNACVVFSSDNDARITCYGIDQSAVVIEFLFTNGDHRIMRLSPANAAILGTTIAHLTSDESGNE